MLLLFWCRVWYSRAICISVSSSFVASQPLLALLRSPIRLETSPAPAEVRYRPIEPGSLGRLDVLRDTDAEVGTASFDILRGRLGGLARGLETLLAFDIVGNAAVSNGLLGRMRRFVDVPESMFKRSLEPFGVPSDVEDTLITVS